MSVPTVNVTCTVNDSEGNPVEGARISAKLSTAEKYNGFVVPLTTNAISDAAGVAVLALFPNELGSESSEYAFKIMDPSTGKSIKFPAVIPNMDCNLFEIANVPPYPREYVGETFTAEVIEARDRAEAAKDAAVQSEANALASENNASSFAADAQQSKSDALASSVSASTSAGQAETAKVAAESARDGAVVAKGGAEAARDEAVSAKNAVDASVAAIPGLIDTEKVAAVGAVQSQETTSVASVQSVYQNDLDMLKSKQAREIGGTAYQTILGFPCPPSLEVKPSDFKNEPNRVPSWMSMTRASTAYEVNEIGQLVQVAADVARIDHDPVTGARLGYLIEEQRTNLLLYSGTFDVANWPRVRSSVVAGVDAPDGSQSIKITEDNTLNQNHMFQSSYAVPGPGDYTASIFIKSDEREEIRLFASGAGASTATFFNASNGTVMGDGTITDYGNGWYRCSVTVSASESGTLFVFVQLSKNSNHIYDGDGVSGLYLWGAQLEQGSFATSYIPTTTAAATRAADNLSITTADFSYNQNEGTCFCDSTTFEPYGGANAFPIIFQIDAGVPSDRVVCNFRVLESYTDVSSAVIDSNVGQVNFAPNAGFAGPIAFAFKAGDFAASFGGLIRSSSAGTLPLALTVLRLGNGIGGPLNGHIRHFAYFPRRLSPEQLQALTR